MEHWDRVGRFAGYGAALAMSPYLLVKLSWVVGALLGLAPIGEGFDRAGWVLLNTVTIGMAGIGIALALALVRPWGMRIPGWLVAFCAWTGAGFLVSILPFAVLSRADPIQLHRDGVGAGSRGPRLPAPALAGGFRPSGRGRCPCRSVMDCCRRGHRWSHLGVLGGRRNPRSRKTGRTGYQLASADGRRRALGTRRRRRHLDTRPEECGPSAPSALAGARLAGVGLTLRLEQLETSPHLVRRRGSPCRCRTAGESRCRPRAALRRDCGGGRHGENAGPLTPTRRRQPDAPARVEAG